MEAIENWYRVSTKAVIVKDGKVLLVKEGSNFWDLPGGGIDHEDEDTPNGLTRELNEELGVALAHYSKLPVFVWKTYDTVNERPIIVLGYRVELKSEDFNLELPVIAAEFMDINDVPAEAMEPYTRPFHDELIAVVGSLAMMTTWND